MRLAIVASIPVTTPRPLSSVKRASVEILGESAEQRSEVLSALATENQKISEYRQRQRTPSKVCSLVLLLCSLDSKVNSSLIQKFM